MNKVRVEYDSIIGQFQRRYNGRINEMTDFGRYYRGKQQYDAETVWGLGWDEEDGSITATVDSLISDNVYAVEMRKSDGQWTVSCDCPDAYNGWCKHAVAVAKAVMDKFEVKVKVMEQQQVMYNSVAGKFVRDFRIPKILDMTDEGRYERGVELFKQGKVEGIEHDNDSIGAICYSATNFHTKYYNVDFTYENNEWCAWCTCPDAVAGWCKHQVAVAIAITHRFKAAPREEYNGMVTFRGVQMKANDVRCLNRIQNRLDAGDWEHIVSVFQKTNQLENEMAQKKGTAIVIIP